MSVQLTTLPSLTRVIHFGTVNSVYRFTYEAGAAFGMLEGLSGTFPGAAPYPISVEDIRDSAWPGEKATARDMEGREVFRSSTVQWESRPPM